LAEPPVLLDSGPLGLLCHTRHGHPEVAAIRRWLRDLRRAGRVVCIPEIADYEVRRELMLLGNRTGIENLDEFGRRFRYLRLTTGILRRAAELWAQARQQATPTAADAALDADVILAAFAEREGGIVATVNVRHLALFVPAKPWQDIQPGG
jgi:predicted nucleic acid-binding protein